MPVEWMRGSGWARFVAALLAPSIFAAEARAAPQTFNTALPVSTGEFLFRGQFLYRRADEDAAPSDREREVLGVLSVLGYGATPRLALFAVVPYLDKEVRQTMPGAGRIARETDGIGDLRFFGRYTLYRDDGPGRTFRIAPFLGLEAPTGRDDERDRFGRLPPALQAGSGSWDPFGGVVLTYQTLAFEIDAAAAYEINTRANDVEFGDVARLDLSFQYRLWPRTLGRGVPGFLYGAVEANLAHERKTRLGGVKDRDTGGTAFYLSPGLQYVTRRWVAEAIAQIPVAQDLNGAALEDDVILRAGFRVNF